MIYLPEEGWSDAREHLYLRITEMAQKIGSMNQLELLWNQKTIIKHLREIADSVKDFCFTIDEVANFDEKEFPEERKFLIQYIQNLHKQNSCK